LIAPAARCDVTEKTHPQPRILGKPVLRHGRDPPFRRMAAVLSVLRAKGLSLTRRGLFHPHANFQPRLRAGFFYAYGPCLRQLLKKDRADRFIGPAKHRLEAAAARDHLPLAGRGAPWLAAAPHRRRDLAPAPGVAALLADAQHFLLDGVRRAPRAMAR